MSGANARSRKRSGGFWCNQTFNMVIVNDRVWVGSRYLRDVVGNGGYLESVVWNLTFSNRPSCHQIPRTWSEPLTSRCTGCNDNNEVECCSQMAWRNHHRHVVRERLTNSLPPHFASFSCRYAAQALSSLIVADRPPQVLESFASTPSVNFPWRLNHSRTTKAAILESTFA